MAAEQRGPGLDRAWLTALAAVFIADIYVTQVPWWVPVVGWGTYVSLWAGRRRLRWLQHAADERRTQHLIASDEFRGLSERVRRLEAKVGRPG